MNKIINITHLHRSTVMDALDYALYALDTSSLADVFNIELDETTNEYNDRKMHIVLKLQEKLTENAFSEYLDTCWTDEELTDLTPEKAMEVVEDFENEGCELMTERVYSDSGFDEDIKREVLCQLSIRLLNEILSGSDAITFELITDFVETLSEEVVFHQEWVKAEVDISFNEVADLVAKRFA